MNEKFIFNFTGSRRTLLFCMTCPPIRSRVLKSLKWQKLNNRQHTSTRVLVIAPLHSVSLHSTYNNTNTQLAGPRYCILLGLFEAKQGVTKPINQSNLKRSNEVNREGKHVGNICGRPSCRRNHTRRLLVHAINGRQPS